jgi:hypothetical protein
MGLTDAQFLLLSLALVAWTVGFFLAIANVCFIPTLSRHRWAHLGFLVAYLGLAFALSRGWLPGLSGRSWGALILWLYAVPAMAIGQFICLLINRRRASERGVRPRRLG